jgi:hypothetical protein
MTRIEHKFDAQGYLDGLDRGRDISPERDEELRQEEKGMEITSLISEAYKRTLADGNRVDIETETHKITAYQIKNQNLIRIDIREQ